MTSQTRWVRSAVLGLCLAVGTSVVVGVADAAPLLDATSPAAVATVFAAPGGTWKSGDKGFGGVAAGTWDTALTGARGWTDYRVEARVELVQPATRQDGLEIGCFAVFRALADLGGYEAAVLVRHESPRRFYRVAVSSLWREVILWRPTGGVVQVAPFPFAVGKAYDLSVICRGPRLTVAVDGQELIDWFDTADPVLGGQVGLARKEGETYVSSLRVATVEPMMTKPAPAVRPPAFREVTWHGQRFFFDGQEPLFLLTSNNVLDLMKFKPGYRPIFYAFNFITDWNRFYPTTATSVKVAESGARLVLETIGMDRNTKSEIPCATKLIVTLDPATGMYAYDQECTVTLPEAECEKVSASWDHGDAVFLGGVGSAQTRDPEALRATYQWSVFQAPDNKWYKVPLNHNGHYLANAASNGGPLKPDGGEWIVVGDPLVSPVIRIPGLTDRFAEIGSGHCWWAYDMHTMFTPKKVNGKIPPGACVSRVIYTGMPAASAAKLLTTAEFYKPGDLSARIPVYAAGVGFTEAFDRDVLLATPHQEHRIWAGRFDRTVGHGDSSSLRLDGATEAWCLEGSSYFVAPYGKRNRVSLWVKTQNVEGEGPTVGFRRWDTNEGSFYATGVKGTTDWTRVEFETTKPIDHWGVTLYFRNSGTGTAWIDDFRIEPIPETTAATAAPTPAPAGTQPPAVRLLPIDPPHPDTVLRWTGKGTGNTILDESGYGHHGKLFGDAMLRDEDGRRVLDLGETGYVWPLSSQALTLGPPCTVVMEVRPETAGDLLYWGFQFGWVLYGAAPKLAFAVQPSGRKAVISKPFLTAGEWQTLAVVVREKEVQLFLNGQPVETLVNENRKGDWGLHTNSTWHRHLGFFGSGPADTAITTENACPGARAKLRSLTVHNRELSAAELATAATTPR